MINDTQDPEDGKLAYDKDGILGELRKRVQWSIAFDADTRSEALEDLKFRAGYQWPDQWRRSRELENRPCLTSNKLPSFIHQITNEQRQNKPSIKIHPVDSNADVEVAEIIQGMIRHIEYASNADVCYDTATEGAVTHGFGYFRLVTEYCDEKSFDQDIRFKRIRNPFTVYCGPHQEPDGSDMMWCVITAEVPRDDFKREYPKAEASAQANWPVGTGDNAVQWLTPDSVRVAEYYRIETKPAILCQMADGTIGYKDEIPNYDPAFCVRERPSEKRVVMWRKCTAIDVLEEVEIPGRYIPVLPVYGDEIDLDGKVIRSGIVRWARDPQRMYNYWITAATEEVALRQKNPYILAAGQAEGFEQQWQQANSRSFPYIEYNPVTIDGTIAPPPQRQPMADIPTGVLAMAMHANDDIKATTGIFDASLGARSNEQSGKAILARQREGDVSNYHYADNLSRAIRHAGRIIVSWIPTIYDTARVVRMLGEDETLNFANINQVEMKHEVDEMSQQVRVIETVLNDVTVGTYDVTVSTGPSYSTMRQEAADAMVQFGQAWPKLMDIAGDKVVKAMDWPGAEEIAERIKRTIPAQITQEEDEKLQIPPQVQQQLDEAGQYIQLLQAELQKLQQEKVTKSAELEQQRYDTDVKAMTQILVEEMKQTMGPLQDMASRVDQIEAALGNIADHLVPAVETMTGQPEGIM